MMLVSTVSGVYVIVLLNLVNIFSIHCPYSVTVFLSGTVLPLINLRISRYMCIHVTTNCYSNVFIILF